MFNYFSKLPIISRQFYIPLFSQFSNIGRFESALQCTYISLFKKLEKLYYIYIVHTVVVVVVDDDDGAGDCLYIHFFPHRVE